MSSTYSSNLRLELIAPGEQANTWGNTTNTNIGTLIEQAVTGKVALDITSGNITLTTLNGAVDQSRAAILVVSGTAGVTRIIYSPANVSKTYVVDNASNVTVTLKTTASGSLGIDVPAGTSKYVYTDGTDFYECSNAATAFTANTVSATTVSATTVTVSGTPTASTDATTVAYVLAAVNAGGFPAGTRMTFAQANPPVYWTAVNSFNNYALRVVNGGTTGGSTGGSVGFTSAFTSQAVTGSVNTSGLSVGNTTLTTAQMPAHTHGSGNGLSFVTDGQPGGYFAMGGSYGILTWTTGTAGSGQPHNHPMSGSATFSGTSINLAVQYLDMIVAQRT